MNHEQLKDTGSNMAVDITFEEFCRKYQISDSTQEKLLKEDIDSIAVLEELTLEELRTMELSIGQRVLLYKGVKAVQEAAINREEKEYSLSIQNPGSPTREIRQCEAYSLSNTTPYGIDPRVQDHFSSETERLLLKRPLQDEFNNNFEPAKFHSDKTEAAVSPSKAFATKSKVNKNIFITNVAFMLMFQSYSGLAIIQSTINGSTGTIGLGVYFATSTVACITISSIMTTAIGCKKTMIVCFAAMTAWMAANFHARTYTILPAAIITGMANGPIWTAQATYFTMLGLQYSEVTGEDEDAVVARFFGLFFSFLLFGTTLGCGITSLILSSSIGDPPVDVSVVSNVTAPSWPVGILPQCGAGYCPGVIQDMLMSITPVYNGTNSNSTAEGVDDPAADGPNIKMMVLVATHVAVNLFATSLMLLTDDLPRSEERKPFLTTMKAGLGLMWDQLKRKRQLLLTPLNLYVGLSQSFVLAEITEAFVACPLGLELLGYALMTYGVTSCLASVISGFLVKYTGRIPVFTFCEMVRLGLVLFLTIWTVDNRVLWVAFMIPGLWALGDGILMSQVSALYGVMFYDNSESAFAAYRFYEGVGLVLGYIANSMFCMRPKLYIILATQVIGWAMYYMAEVSQRRVQRKQTQQQQIVKT